MTIETGSNPYTIEQDSNGNLVYKHPTNGTVATYDEANDKWVLGSLDIDEVGNSNSPVDITDILNVPRVSKGSTTEITRGKGADNAGFQMLAQPTDDVSTTAKQIMKTDPQMDGNVSMLIIVTGDKQGGNARFSDIINFSTTDILNVIDSGGVNSPDSRTYSRNFNGNHNFLELSMSANTYDVVATALGVTRTLN